MLNHENCRRRCVAPNLLCWCFCSFELFDLFFVGIFAHLSYLIRFAYESR